MGDTRWVGMEWPTACETCVSDLQASSAFMTKCYKLNNCCNGKNKSVRDIHSSLGSTENCPGQKKTARHKNA